ncbi:lipid phosphate phosphatase epsilon 1, chloroplastic-like [Bidens hawaiensis]|uniref:lipid phosphate phosphatase epsilon 1, chloroplastic-like n=1 Tax=Bidens hawaiensis TaxID=980011 RepID=UPI00404B4023
MASGSLEAGILEGDEPISLPLSALEQEALIENENENENENDGLSFHQTPGGRLHAIVNLMSKWIVAVSFGGFLFLRRDALALWAAMGSVINMILSVTLKQILKQERPVSRVSSGHGMPSSHAQAIFYTIVCIILSLVEFQGFSGVTAIASMFVVAIGSYFSWLRVSQRYHTSIQVIVGAIVGSVFAVMWFWAWEAVVYKAYESTLVVRVLVTVGAAGFTLGFISHVIRHWLKGED